MKQIKFKNLKYVQIIALTFVGLILLGTLLLMLPISTKSGESASFTDSLFTATSASCVTGLIVQDTYRYWSLFGQVVILGMIQIGGLGFMTVATMVSMMLKRKISLKERGILQESVNISQIGGIVRLTKKVVIGTLIFEGVGAVILAFRFCPDMGFARGVYNSVFHSISAFCNAGFDLMGKIEPYSSLMHYSSDAIVNVVIMLLIVIGGIGFIVWDDIMTHKFRFKKYQLHTKIVLVATAVLIFGGALLIYIFEYSNLFKGMSEGEKILASFFHSITPRTAGFNTVDLAKMSESSKFLTLFLMFIGGSPGSTAGGVKTTTIVVLLLALKSSFANRQEIDVFNRRLEADAVRKAVSVVTTNLTLIIVVTLTICAIQPLNLTEVMLETFSAMSTVGMSTGITRELNTISQMLICLLMYCGRVGSLSFALSFASNKASVVQLPEAKINIG